jgi:hypothetical protein
MIYKSLAIYYFCTKALDIVYSICDHQTSSYHHIPELKKLDTKQRKQQRILQNTKEGKQHKITAKHTTARRTGHNSPSTVRWTQQGNCDEESRESAFLCILHFCISPCLISPPYRVYHCQTQTRSTSKMQNRRYMSLDASPYTPTPSTILVLINIHQQIYAKSSESPTSRHRNLSGWEP